MARLLAWDEGVSADVVGRRLQAQQLAGEASATPEEAVGRLGAVQAQDVRAAKWAVGARVRRATAAQLDEACAAGRILRTHVLRATWHFVLPADIRLLLAVTAPRVLARSASRLRQLGLDEETRRRSREALAEALTGGTELTREEAGQALSAAGIDVARQRLPYLLMDAELNAVICSGVPRGAAHTYALLDERVPQDVPLAPEEALAELAFRYFRSHGPASAGDFATWASLRRADVQRAVAAAGSRLRCEVVAGLPLWSAAASAPVAPPPGPLVRLISGYDEYIVGYTETKSLLAAPGSAWTPATPPVFALVVLVNGRMAGFWRRRVRGDEVAIEVSPLQPFTGEEQQALADEARRYAAFLGRSAHLDVP
jgi:hypothetical protein